MFFKKCLKKYVSLTFVIFLIGGGSGFVLPLIISSVTGQDFWLVSKESAYYGTYYDFLKKPDFNYAMGFALISLAYLNNPLISVLFSSLSIFTHPMVATSLVLILAITFLYKLIKHKKIEKGYLIHLIPVALYLIYIIWAGIVDPTRQIAIDKLTNDFVYGSVTEGFISKSLSNPDFWNFVFQNFFYKHLSLSIFGLIGFYLLFKNKEDIVNNEYKSIILLGFITSFLDLIPNFFPFTLNIPIFRFQISRIKLPFLPVLFVIGLIYLFNKINNKIKNKNKILSFIFLGFILIETITYTANVIKVYLIEIKSPWYGYHIDGTNYIVWEYLKNNLTEPSLILVHPYPIGIWFLTATTQHRSLCFTDAWVEYNWHEECVVEYTNEFWSPKASPEQKRAFLDKYNVSYVWIDPYMLTLGGGGNNTHLFGNNSNPIQVLYDSFMNIPGTEIVFGVVTDYPMDIEHIRTLPSILLKIKR